VKKRVAAVIIALCLAAALIPAVSQAAVIPYFMAVNDTLLPFNDSTMPFVSGGEFFVSDRVFEGDSLDVWAIGSGDLEFVRLYGAGKYVDFYTARAITMDHDGNTLHWPSARRVGARFYVPLRHVAEHFGLSYEILEVPRDIIPNEQMWVVRIISSAVFNGQTFVGLNRNAIRTAYNDYFPSQSPQPPRPTVSPPPVIEPPPNHSDVTIYLSFFDISAGWAGGILDLLDIQETSGYLSCFFLSSADIADNPDLIRRISGSGHSIGIWLEEGGFDEYLEASAFLFEAAKVKTVIVSANGAVEQAMLMADENGLVFWDSAQSIVNYGNLSVNAITATIPRDSGVRRNLLFSCSERAASVLPGVYSFLMVNEYSVVRITETTEPIRR